MKNLSTSQPGRRQMHPPKSNRQHSYNPGWGRVVSKKIFFSLINCLRRPKAVSVRIVEYYSFYHIDDSKHLICSHRSEYGKIYLHMYNSLSSFLFRGDIFNRGNLPHYLESLNLSFMPNYGKKNDFQTYGGKTAV